MPDRRRELLVVDGYNVIRATDRYAHLIDEGDDDPYLRAREALLSDVAAFAQGSYDPVVVFDGAGNLSPERPNLSSGSVRVVYSRTGQDADEVIEQLAVEARYHGGDLRQHRARNHRRRAREEPFLCAYRPRVHIGRPRCCGCSLRQVAPSFNVGRSHFRRCSCQAGGAPQGLNSILEKCQNYPVL